MKTPTRTRSLITLLMILTLALWYPPGVQSAVTGRSADSSLAGTEKLLSDSSGTDTYILLSTLWGTAQPLSAGITATGSSSWNFSGSTGTFLTSSGLNTFGGSGHAFASILYPSANDGAALGDLTHGFSDLFLASGAVININNSNWIATHTSGILTVGTGDLRVTTAGTNTASVVTVGGTQTLTAKTLTSPVIATGLTASGSAANTFAGSTGTFITSTGINTFKGSAHNFDAVLQPTTDDAAALGTTLLGFSDLFLATGGTVHFGNTDWVATHSTGVLTVGTGNIIISTAGTAAGSVLTNNGTQTATNKTFTAPVLGGTITGTYTLDGTLTIDAPILSGTATGTYTLAGTPTITSPTITGAKVTPNVQTITGDGAITIQSGVVLLTKGSAAAITLAAPSSQDGTVIEITSTTDFAHVITVTGGLWDGTAGSNTTITLAAVAGSGVKLIAFGTDWYVLSNQGTTIAP